MSEAMMHVAAATLAALLAACAQPPGEAEQSSTVFAPASGDLAPVARSRLHVTEGRVDGADGTHALKVDIGGMRAVISGDTSQTAELAFQYLGPSATTALLAHGELRRQIGLKLRAKDSCNVVYVMWHIEPTPGIAILVKRNADVSTDAECGTDGYLTVARTTDTRAPLLRSGESHLLRADLDGDTLTVLADGALAWKGTLPDEALAFDGPAGVRSDNGNFDFELRVPRNAL
ncbi:MAG: hypothetical protein JWO86_7437 [Myxococcaceae bacterium]|nr:hypothetical protein [Myxococcaceae bacterium]